MSDATPKRPLFFTPVNEPPADTVGRLFLLPRSDEWLALFAGAVSMLFNDLNWAETEGGVSIEDTIQVFIKAHVDSGDNFMIGSVFSTTRDPLPDYLLLCDGANYSGDAYPELYAIIGDEFRLGDGTFVVPNLQGKFVLGDLPPELIEGLDFVPGDIGGEYDHVLSVDEIPSHTHTQDAHNHTQNAHNHTSPNHLHGVPSVNNGTIGANPILLRSTAAAGINTNTTNQTATIDNATATNQATTAVNQNTGGGDSHNNMPPYYVLRYAIVAR